MEIKRKCPLTGVTNTRTLDVTVEQLIRWENGEYAQDVFPHLSADDREFLISGTTSDVWDAMFGEEEPV